MATTIVEWEHVPDRRGSRSKLVLELKAAYEEDQRNDDKCGSSDDCSYYCGRMDAVHDILYTYGWRVKGREIETVEAKPCEHDYAFVHSPDGKLLCDACDEQVSLYADNGMIQYHFNPEVRQYYRVDVERCQHKVLKVVASRDNRGLANECEACGMHMPDRRPGDPILYEWDTQARRYIKITEEKNG